MSNGGRRGTGAGAGTPPGGRTGGGTGPGAGLETGNAVAPHTGPCLVRGRILGTGETGGGAETGRRLAGAGAGLEEEEGWEQQLVFLTFTLILDETFVLIL